MQESFKLTKPLIHEKMTICYYMLLYIIGTKKKILITLHP